MLGAAGRRAEGEALCQALASGQVHEAEQLLLWGVETLPGFLDTLAPEGILTVRKTIKAIMGRQQRVKPGDDVLGCCGVGGWVKG